MSLSDKAIYIYNQLTDLDQEIRTKSLIHETLCVGSHAIFDRIFYQTFLGFIAINKTLLCEN